MRKLFSLLIILILSSAVIAQERARDTNAIYDDALLPVPQKPTNTVKWEETFDTTTQPADWQVIDNDGSGTFMTFTQQLNFTSGTVNPQAGQSFWFSSWQNSAASGLIDEWLITPQLPLIENGDSLFFYAGAIGGSFDDSLKVYVSTTDANPASFSEIAYFKVDGPVGAWNLYGFDMSAYAGNQVYVAVNYYIVDGGPTGTHSDNVWIDHFILTSSEASTTARLQIIHNSADPAAALVDIYLDGTLALEDVPFRGATPYIDFPAGVEVGIGIAPANGSILTTIPVTLDVGETYVAIASGVLDPNQFAANPDGVPTAFELLVKTMARETALTSNVEFFILHGSTDAPTVDVIAREASLTLADDAAYTDMTGYLEVPPAAYTLDVTPGSNPNSVLLSYAADLSSLSGQSLVAFASGFFNPQANQNGPAFGVFAALANGTVVELPLVNETARLQIIHNAADPAAALVDIYLDGTLAIEDFAFRQASTYIDFPAGVDVNVGIAPANGSIITTIPVNLAADETYVAIANGVLDPNQFAANPDGRSTAFELLVKPMAREAALSSNVEFFILHGSTDAPTVDIIAREASLTLADDAAYTDMTGYLEVPPAAYTIDLTPGNDPNNVLFSYIAELSGLGGGTAVVFASGFLNPSANQNGAEFGIFAALADGTVIQLPQGVVPVELTSFTAVQQGNFVELNWVTATESNNMGFEIERRLENSDWRKVGFKEGAGSTTLKQVYSYRDDISNLNASTIYYRLKQVDFDGTFEYSDEVAVEALTPTEFSISQNYPNPFNPSTSIKFAIPVDSEVSLKVFNAIGQEVVELANQVYSAGSYELNFNASNLTSGIYFYSLTAKGSDGSSFVETRKMMLMK